MFLNCLVFTEERLWRASWAKRWLQTIWRGFSFLWWYWRLLGVKELDLIILMGPFQLRVFSRVFYCLCAVVKQLNVFFRNFLWKLLMKHSALLLGKTSGVLVARLLALCARQRIWHWSQSAMVVSVFGTVSISTWLARLSEALEAGCLVCYPMGVKDTGPIMAVMPKQLSEIIFVQFWNSSQRKQSCRAVQDLTTLFACCGVAVWISVAEWTVLL